MTQKIDEQHPLDVAFRIDGPGDYTWKCPTAVPDEMVRRPLPEGNQELNPVKPIEAMTVAAYEAFIDANSLDKRENRIALGRTLYEHKGCNSCHTLDGSTKVGPSWKGIWGTTVKSGDGKIAIVDAAYVRMSLMRPTEFVVAGFPSMMPSFEGQLRETEIVTLIEFIESLKN